MPRILLCGSVRGRFGLLSKQLLMLHEKAFFDLAVCTGDFFGDLVGLEDGDVFRRNVDESGTDDPECKSHERMKQLSPDVLDQVSAELNQLGSDLPFPLYIVDEASTRYVRRRLRGTCGCSPNQANNSRDSVRNDGSHCTLDSISSMPSNTASFDGFEQAATAEGFPENSSDKSSCVKAEEVSAHDDRVESVALDRAEDQAASNFTRLTNPLKIAPNIYALEGCGIAELCGLRVAFYSFSNDVLPKTLANNDKTISCCRPLNAPKFMKALICKNSRFRGEVDLFITYLAPSNIFDCTTSCPAEDSQNVETKASEGENTLDLHEISGLSMEECNNRSSENCGFLLNFLEPRFCVFGGLGIYWQRPQFRGRYFEYCIRVLSLGTVGEKGRRLKAFHALQLKPIVSMLQMLENDPNGIASSEEQRKADVDLARSALYFVDGNACTNNPYGVSRICGDKDETESREEACELMEPPPPPPRLPYPTANVHGPMMKPRPRRDTGVVLVENLPFQVNDGEGLRAAMERFGTVKFVYVPKDKTDSEKGTGKAYVVFVEPKDAAAATEASGQLESGNRSLRMRLFYDKIPFDKSADRGKRKRCGEVIDTHPHAECWFCLANPQCEKHLVVDIGEMTYLAIPKGAIHERHILIVPITHMPSLAFSDEGLRTEVSKTIDRLRKNFHAMNLDLIVYERYIPMKATKAMHTQLHVVPCQRTDSLRALEFFQKRGKRIGISFEKLPSSGRVEDITNYVDGTDAAYFYVEIPGVCTSSGQTIDRLLYVQHRSDAKQYAQNKLPLNFGREVICDLIGKQEFINWQECIVSREEEVSRVDRLRQML